MRAHITPHPTRDGWYYVVYRPDGVKGKLTREPVKGYDKACLRRDELEEVYNAVGEEKVAHPALQDVYRDYLAWCERNQSAATYKGKRYAFEQRIIPHFGKYRVKEINQRIYDEFQALYAGKRRAIIMYQDYLGALIKWMVKRKYALPMTFKPEKPKYHLPSHSICDITELDTFIAAIGAEEEAPKLIRCQAARDRKLQAVEAKRMILVTMLWTGLRWNEVINLRWEDVNVRRGEIIVKESIEEAAATVRISPEMHPWFEKHKKFQGWVFLNPDTVTEKNPGGMHYTTMKTTMNNAAKRTGITITPHDIRRTSAMMIYESTNGDILAVQRHLRHKDIKTTIRYLECSGVRMKSAQESMISYIEEKRRIESVNVINKIKSVKAG